jgi:succinate dehydrogenase flavin-adding protein (antitoxin of CptAB toxin-antitoxin module)
MPERCAEGHGERLASFQTLLIYTDTDLLDLVRARAECRDAQFVAVVGRLRDS